MTIEGENLDVVEAPTQTPDEKVEAEQQQEQVQKDENEDYNNNNSSGREAFEAENRDDNNDDETEALIGDVMQEWAAGTSVHGVALASDRQTYSLWFRLFWMCIVLLGAGIMVWQIEALVNEFLNYDITTDTSILVPGAMEFPEITLCNNNPFSARKQAETGIVDPLDEEDFDAITPSLDSFIVYTEFNEEWLPANETTWTPIRTDFGPCWQFYTDAKVYRPGGLGGLTVYAWLNQEDYSNATDYAGIRIFVTQKDTRINVQLPFATVTAGTDSIINIRKTEYGRDMKAPWKKCSGRAPNYTQTQCREECANLVFASRCGCRFYGDTKNTDMPYCGLTENEEDLNCYYEFSDTEAVEICEKEGLFDCSKPPCEITTYETSTEVQQFSEKLLNQFESEFGGEVSFKKNFVGVRINYDKLQYEVVTQSPAVTVATLLGSIGGSMGLFMGISALSVVEIFGDLIGMRLMPRLFGHRSLYGVGGRR